MVEIGLMKLKLIDLQVMEVRMNENVKIIENIISKVLKENNYKKKGLSWYQETNDTVVLLELQKSSWGMQFYINIAVFLKVFGSISLPPKEWKCHIRGRLSSPEGEDKLGKALDLETEYILDERERIILKYLHEYALPILNSFKSLRSIKQLIDNENKKDFLVSLKAKEYLNNI
jgi:hypothetical protein